MEIFKIICIAIPGAVHTLGHVIRAKTLGVKCKVRLVKWGAVETYEDATPEQMKKIALWGFGAEFFAMYLFTLLVSVNLWCAFFAGFYAGSALWHWFEYPSNSEGFNDFNSLCTHADTEVQHGEL